jgi:hypothetical protein
MKMNRSDCYAVVPPLPGSDIPEEFQAADLLAWSDRLMGFATCPAAVGLLLKLDAMARMHMPGGHRVLLLRVLEAPLDRVLQRLPRPTETTIEGRDLSMEQRLVCMACRNITLAHMELDSVGLAREQCEVRLWLVEQQFRLAERQLLFGARAGMDPPPGTWLEVHARYQQVVQGLASKGKHEAPDDCGTGFEPLLAYCYLLLLGIAIEALGAGALAEGVLVRLRALAAQSVLGGPDRGDDQLGEQGSGFWVLDPSLDIPARRAGSAVGEGMRVLAVAPGFLELIETTESSHNDGVRAG